MLRSRHNEREGSTSLTVMGSGGERNRYVAGQTPKLEFAYDEDVFKIAYKTLEDKAKNPTPDT